MRHPWGFDIKVDTYRFPTWDKYVNFISSYTELSHADRDKYIFRGQCNANWCLLSSVDRKEKPYASLEERDSYIRNLINNFRYEAILIDPENSILNSRRDEITERQLEIFARHHGLVTPILDWTQSPFIATFFALWDAPKENDVCVWVLDRNIFREKELPGIDILETDHPGRLNKRLVSQRAEVMRVDFIQEPLETLFDGFIFRMVIPYNVKEQALNALDEMTINAGSLYLNLDAAARTAMQRMVP